MSDAAVSWIVALNLHINCVHTKGQVDSRQDVRSLYSSSLGSIEGKALVDHKVAPAAPGTAGSDNTEHHDGQDSAVDGIRTDRVPVVLLQKISVLQLL